MNEWEPIDLNTNRVKYWDGATNRFSRYLAYFMKCVELINQGKYILAFLGLGVFKSDIVISGWTLLLGGLIAIPIMIIIGRWYMQKAQKTMEFVNMLTGSVTGYDSYNMQVETVKLLRKIAEKQVSHINSPNSNTL